MNRQWQKLSQLPKRNLFPGTDLTGRPNNPAAGISLETQPQSSSPLISPSPMPDEEEFRAEVDAVQAVYGDDCLVIEAYPPHLHVHLKPRTADVSSQQFVEATLGVRAGPQYPEEPPEISIIDSKGLDEKRQKHLLASIRAEALQLVSCLMLVALCEEAVGRLSSMNHPDGDCPLCLHPLLDDEDADGSSSTFMKLMSCFHCFHCFHCHCIIRWWNWSQVQNEQEIKSSSSSSSRIMQQNRVEDNMAKCPVCRKVFHAKDIEHVLNLVGGDVHLDPDGSEIEKVVFYSDSEKTRRQKFEAILRRQQENDGLIEPKKKEVLLPGVFLPQPVSAPPTESVAPSTTEARKKDPRPKVDANQGSSFNRPGPRSHGNMRKHRSQYYGKQARNRTNKDDA